MLSPVESKLFLDTCRSKSAGCLVRTVGHAVLVGWVFRILAVGLGGIEAFQDSDPKPFCRI